MGLTMPLETLIEFDIDRFRRKDLELAGWLTADVDRTTRKPASRPSFLSQWFATVTYAVNPGGFGTRTVNGCVFSEPQGKHKIACSVELNLAFNDSGAARHPDGVRSLVAGLARLSLDPGAAIDALVKSAAVQIQADLTTETIYDFDSVVLPRFRDAIAASLLSAGFKASMNLEWEGYVADEPFALDDVVAPFRIPGVARRLETKLSCEIVADPRQKAVIACLRPKKERVARVAKEAIAAYFDDETLFATLLDHHRAVEKGCERAINDSLLPYAHRVRGFALSKPQGLPSAPPEQIQVDVETPIQLTDSETPVPLRHTAQLALVNRSQFIVRSLDQAIDPKQYAVEAIRGAAAKLLQGKTFVDLVQAFVLDPLTFERTGVEPKLELGKKFSDAIKERLTEIGFDIHHIATTPKAKVVDLLIQRPYITLAQREYRLHGGSIVMVGITFNGALTSLDAVRGRITRDTDPTEDMQNDLPSLVQNVLGGVTPFEFDMGTSVGETGQSWLSTVEDQIKQRLAAAYGFTVHNVHVAASESEPRAYLRKLQAGGAHSFFIDNHSPGTDGQTQGLRLKVTYGVVEPRLTELPAEKRQTYTTYERYIEAGLYRFEVEEAHLRIQGAIGGELKEVLGQLRRDNILRIVTEGKNGPDEGNRKWYLALLKKATDVVSQSFGLSVDLRLVLDSDDLSGVRSFLADADKDELRRRREIETELRISKAAAAREAFEQYHRALLSYDHATADDEDRRRLDGLKKIAQDLEEEAQIGKRSHLGNRLTDQTGGHHGQDPSLLLAGGTDVAQAQDDIDDNILDIKVN